MKKQEIAGLIVYLLMLSIALVFGFTVLRTHQEQSTITGWMYALYVIGALTAGIVLTAIFIELGHIIGAKIGRYNILAVTILGLCFYKKEKGIGFKFSKFDGLSGETTILPKNKKKSDPRPYLSFATLLILLEIVLGIVLFITFKSLAINNKSFYDIAYFILTMAIVAALILFYNIIPVELDTTNDGYRLRLISNPKNKEALNELLVVNYELSKGNTNIEIKVFEEITNFTAGLNLSKVYISLTNHQYDEADRIINIILSGKESISTKMYLNVKALKMSLLILEKPLEEAQEYYEKEIGPQENRMISEETGSLPCLRSYVLTSALFDKSKSECILALSYVQNAYKKVVKANKPIEKELLNKSIDIILQSHQSWDITDYKL